VFSSSNRFSSILCSDGLRESVIGEEKLRAQRVKGGGITNRSQLFKTILFLDPKVMAKTGAPVIPANCNDPDWATHLGPREPSAIMIILWFLFKTLISDRAAGTVFLYEEPRITE
jgi:hypothetical protein